MRLSIQVPLDVARRMDRYFLGLREDPPSSGMGGGGGAAVVDEGQAGVAGSSGDLGERGAAAGSGVQAETTGEGTRRSPKVHALLEAHMLDSFTDR